MENWESYFFQPKPIEEIINDALVVVDTNVLLAAYQWREVTVNEVLNILKSLNDKDRLRIPEQVIKEFAKRRPTEIIQRINEIDNIISQLQKTKPLNQRVPMLEGMDIYEKVMNSQEIYDEKLNDYKEGLIEIKQILKGLFISDPILDSIQEIFKNARYKPENIEEDKLSKIAKERFVNKIPPGYKDGSKEQNSEGDYIIWAHILNLDSDVIFISAEKKIDWAYTDKHNNVINVRRELVVEFSRETSGKSFCFINPKNFIKLVHPDISDEVIEDLEVELDFDYYYNLKSRHVNNILKKVNGILNSYDPMGIAAIAGLNEYDIEAKLIMDLFPKVKTELEMILCVRKIFIEEFHDGPSTSLERMSPIGRELFEYKLIIDGFVNN